MTVNNKQYGQIIDKDDEVSYEALSEHLIEDTERKKKKAVREIEEFGEQFLVEIDKKKLRQKTLQDKLIPYILKKTESKYTKEELKSYNFDDVKKIYDELKTEHSPLIKIFQFIFNI